MQWNPSEYDIEHSLLQKAVRRGNEELTDKVVRYLISKDNLKWLRKRLAVITYEECWTLGNELPSEKNQIIRQYKKLACSVKNKNAFGLAALAEDTALIGNQEENDAIRSIAYAIDHPDEFWKWIGDQPGYRNNQSRIESAKNAVNKAGFPADKNMMYAAAYLSVKNKIPETKIIQPNNDPDFPYWIAFDKHTDAGRQIIYDACNRIGLDSYKGMQLTFYFAGSVCNQITDSPYWELLKPWKMKKIGFTMDEAEEKWEELKPLIIEKTKGYVESLAYRLDKDQESDQLGFNF